MRVLVVDDDETLLRATTAILRMADIDVAGASSGEQALESLATRTPDAVLIDLMMPRMNGIELIRTIQARHPEVRVVLTSSFPLSTGQIERMGLESVSFVTKPFDPDSLIRLLMSGREPAKTGSGAVRPAAEGSAGSRVR